MNRALLLLALVACGPDEGSDDTGTPTTSATTPTSSDTWTDYAADFFVTYCVSCHGDGDDKDFNQYADVVAHADSIRCGVSAVAEDGCGTWPPPAQFPIGSGPMPSDDERARIVAWIDAGLPE